MPPSKADLSKTGLSKTKTKASFCHRLYLIENGTLTAFVLLAAIARTKAILKALTKRNMYCGFELQTGERLRLSPGYFPHEA